LAVSPRTSQGGSTAGGVRQVLLPLVLRTVKDLINKEMDALVEELKEKSSDEHTRYRVDEVQEKIRDTVPVFYDLVKTAA